MNYQFENIYTPAELIRWRGQVASKLETGSQSITSGCLVFLIQFCLWAPMLYVISPLELSFLIKAIVLFMAYFFVGSFYDSVVHPHISARFDKKADINTVENLCAIITVNDEGVRTQESDYEITFKWSDIREIEDDEKTVFLLTKTGYCLIPARCFPGFLEKDAFVRACREKISGYTEQGAHFA